MSGYKVIVEAVEQEAKKWDRLGDDLGAVRDALRDATLLDTAFMLADPVTLPIPNNGPALAEAYEKFRAEIEAVLGGATTEFAQLRHALVKVAEAYKEAERVTEEGLNQIYHR